MQIPTIHLNGTSGDALLTEYEQAIRAIDKARDALAAVTVHGRDYYVQGATAGQLAMAEHAHHLAQLAKIEEELTEVYHGIVRQLEAKQR